MTATASYEVWFVGESRDDDVCVTRCKTLGEAITDATQRCDETGLSSFEIRYLGRALDIIENEGVVLRRSTRPAIPAAGHHER